MLLRQIEYLQAVIENGNFYITAEQCNVSQRRRHTAYFPRRLWRLIEHLKVKNLPAILPIQIAYYAGLHIGEVCGFHIRAKNKGRYISFHYLRGQKARKIRKVQEISPPIPIYLTTKAKNYV